MDTVFVKKNQSIVFADSVYNANSDTTLIIGSKVDYFVVADKYSGSSKFINALRERAFRTAITRSLYKSLFAEESIPVDTLEDPQRSEVYFEAYEGTVIRSIRVVKVDVLEGSVVDTLYFSASEVSRLINQFHVNTNNSVIRKQLLFHRGDDLDPYLMADSERNLRSLPYIQDAKIYLKKTSENENLTDVVIVVKDRFSWAAELKGNLEEYFLVAGNGNFLGSGNKFEVAYLRSSINEPKNGLSSELSFRNIRKSFVNATFFTGSSFQYQGSGLRISRPFISPEIRYTGEFLYSNTLRRKDILFGDSIYADVPVDSRVVDTWLSKGFNFDRRKTVNVSVRYLNNKFSQRPLVKSDSNEVYQNRRTVLGGLFFSEINYYKATNILAFNITEDVPVGYLMSVVAGEDQTEFDTRYYTGLQLAYGAFTPYGYFSFNAGAGRFWFDQNSINKVADFNGNYFTPLINLNGIQNRTFFKGYYFTSDELSAPQVASLITDNRVRNIEGTGIAGNKVISATIESVFFLPKGIYGFRFAPYLFTDFGHVVENRIRSSFTNNYQTLGAGIRIKNESLIFDTIEFRFATFIKDDGLNPALTFNFTVSRPVLFSQINVRKPRLIGID